LAVVPPMSKLMMSRVPRLDDCGGSHAYHVALGHAAVALHNVERGFQPQPLEVLIQPGDVGVHDGHEGGVYDGGAEALILPVLVGYHVGGGDVDAVQGLSQRLIDLFLVEGVGVAVEEAHGHALDARGPQLIYNLVHLLLVDGRRDLAFVVHPLLQLVPVPSLDQHGRPLEEQVVYLSPTLPAYLDDISKPFRGDQRRDRELQVYLPEERVGGDGGCVAHHPHVFGFVIL